MKKCSFDLSSRLESMTAAAIKIKTFWHNRTTDINASNALIACLLLCIGYAFCRGFYMPNIWSSNYWLINFFDGFGRRALLGTLLYPLGEWRNHYHFIAFVQIATSTVLLGTIIWRLTAWQRQHPETYIYIYVEFVCRAMVLFSLALSDILTMCIT